MLAFLFLLFSISMPVSEALLGQPRSWIGKVEFSGNHFFSGRKLRREIHILEGRSKLLDTLELQTCREIILAAYSTQGFPEAEVSWSVVSLDTLSRSVRIHFQIEEGKRWTIQSLTISGNHAVEVELLREVVSLREGGLFDPRKLGEDEYLIHLVYANRGYAFAKVDHEVVRNPPGLIHLTYRVEEGPQVYFGIITLSGNEQTKPHFLLAQSGIRSGQVFSLERLGRGQQLLLETGVLKEASFTPSGLTPEGKINLILEVKEKSNRWISTGLGYGASDQFRISGEWGHRNLWGRGKRIVLKSYGGFALVPKIRNVIARSEVSFGDPFLFSTYWRGSISGYHERDAPVSEAYRAQRWGGLLGLEREWAGPGIFSGEVRYEKVTLSDTFAFILPDSLRFRTTRTVGLRWRKDFRTPLRRALRGALLRLSEEYAGGMFGGDNNFVRTQGGAAFFLSLFGGMTLASRAEGGNVENLPDEKAVPIYERFFLGGAGSLRGYPEKGLSPQDSLGRLLGGHRYLLGSLEIRVRTDRRWGGAVFSDFGDVWLAEERLSYKALRTTAGGELHYFTPVGPVRAGLALKLSPETGKPKSAYYVASGLAF